MNEITTLVQKNSLNLPSEVIERIQRQVRIGSIAPLSPDKESGPFMLYACGDALEDIAVKVNLPVDIIYATAMRYEWNNKVSVLRGDIKDIQKSLASSILVATYITAQKDLGDVIAGRKTAKQCGLLPSNIAGLEKLMAMVSGLNEAKAEPNTGTVVHAQNVQINQIAETPKVPSENTEELKAKFDLIKTRKK